MEKQLRVGYTPQALKFIDNLEDDTREKIFKNIFKALKSRDPKLFKKVKGDIWEFRTNYQGNNYRLLAFWNKKQTSQIICTHGFVKQKNKLPLQEIENAKRIMKEYYQKE